MTDSGERAKRFTIICFSGDFDRALAAFTLATGAAAMNYDVNMFFTFWGLNIVKRRKGRAWLGRGLVSRFFNFLMGGERNLPLSRLNFAGLSPLIMTGLMQKRNIATLPELITAAKELNVKFTACEMSMHTYGLSRDDLIPEITGVVGVPTFLSASEGGQTVFI